MSGTRFTTRVLTTVAIMIAAGLMILTGCSSDSVTPNDETPALTRDEAAQQAGAVAAGVSRLAPLIVLFNPPKADEVGVYPYEVFGDLSGNLTIETFTGGMGGTHIAYGVADYGVLYTDPGAPIHGEIPLTEDLMAIFDIGFDLGGPLDPDLGTAVVSGTGTVFMGPYTPVIGLADVEVDAGAGYPAGGTVTVTSTGWEMMVEFDGDNSADILLDGTKIFEANLDTGEITAVSE